MSAKGKLISAGVVLSLCAGLVALGWYWGKPRPVVETNAPQVVQDDGSVALERKPDAQAQPKMKVPKGAKVERVAAVTVKPDAVATAGAPCPDVTVDLALIREKDGMKRVIASSPDGRVVSGIDIPIETAAPPPEPHKWAAGLSYNPVHQTGGMWVERDISRIRLGVELNQARSVADPRGAEFRLRAGLTF